MTIPKDVLEMAQAAFFAVLQQHYKLPSGDFPPDAQAAFDTACERACAIWRDVNRTAVIAQRFRELGFLEWSTGDV